MTGAKRFFAISLRWRLLGAFVGISGFALLAAAAGLYALGQVGSALIEIVDERTPSALAELEISRQAELIVSAGPALLGAASQRERGDAAKLISGEIERMQRLLARLKERQAAGDTLSAIETAVADLRSNLEALSVIAERRLAVADDKNDQLGRLASLSVTANRLLQPAVLVLDSQIAAFKRSIGSTELAPTPEALSDMLQVIATSRPIEKAQLAANALNAGLLQAANATGPDLALLIRPLQRALSTLDEFDQAMSATIRPRFEQMVSGFKHLADGPDSIVAARTTELSILAQGEQLLEENTAISRRLTAAVDGLAATASQQIHEAGQHAMGVQRFGRTVLLAVAALSFTCSGLIVWLYVDRSLLVRLSAVSAGMRTLAAGDLHSTLPAAQHNGSQDEIGAMARTLEAFRERLIALRAFEGDKIIQETNKVAESRFRDMLDVSPIGVVIVTAEGRALYCNAGFASMLGSTPERIRARNIAAIWNEPDDRRRMLDRLDSGARLRDLEVTLRREGGGTVTCLLSGEPISYEGETASLRWAYDITERKRAEAEIRAAQSRLVQSEKLASLGQLAAGIAHEIKNPLNFVSNFADLSRELLGELRETLAPATLAPAVRQETEELTAMMADNLDKVVQHGKRADSIVKSMLLHSREGGGERRRADINATVQESLNLAYHGLRAEKPDFNVTLKTDLDPAVEQVEVFPQEITRVLLNLISNGFYAANRRKAELAPGSFEPELRAATHAFADRVEIRIRDNGAGIPDEVRAKLFTPFFTTKPPGEGTGLGLSLSHDIVVKQHGGSITVNTRRGEFTEFVVSLPRSATVAGLQEAS